jgi:hypothetical protein
MKKLLLVLILVLLAMPVWGATYYVSTTGSDLNGGTDPTTDAWLTLDYALTGQRIADGDIVELEAGTYSTFNGAHTNIGIDINDGVSGSATVRPYNGGSVTLDIPVAASSRFLYLYNDDFDITFEDIAFTNSNSDATSFGQIAGGGGSFTFNNCTFDHNNVNAYMFLTTGVAGGASVNFYQCEIKNGAVGYDVFRSNDTTNASEVSFQSCLIYDIGQVADSPEAYDITFINNTVYGGKTTNYINLREVGSTLTGYNNIFHQNATCLYSVLFSDTSAADVISNPSYFVFKNNIHYTATLNNILYFIYNGNYLVPVDKSNRFFDPSFTDEGNDDYTIASGSKISGFGNSDQLPALDIDGNTWTGADVGCYQNPSATKWAPTLNGNAAFVGDSIMNGSGITAGQECFSEFQTLSGITTYGKDTVAIGGYRAEHLRFFADYVMENYPATHIFFSAGINNTTTPAPANITATQLSAELVTVLEKFEDYGCVVYWLGMTSDLGATPDNTMEKSVNNSVYNTAATNGWGRSKLLEAYEVIPNWETLYYTDLSTNLHPNAAGHDRIAAVAMSAYGKKFVDIGAYEYQGVVGGPAVFMDF